MEVLLWISLPAYTVGVVSIAGQVRQAPPIVHWCIGKRTKWVADYFKRRGAEIWYYKDEHWQPYS